MNKKIIIPAALLVTAVGTGVFLTKPVLAQEGETPHQSIIERLVARFGLNQEEVESVFQEERQDRQAEMQNQFEAKLDEAIAAGELSEDQKALILAKHEELRQQNENQGPKGDDWHELSAEERQAKMEEEKASREARQAELQAWAEANGIDMKYFNLGRGEFEHGPEGRGMGMGRQMNANQ